MSRRYIAASKRQIVIHRAQGRCEYCQIPSDYATQTFPLDHIIPVSRGGKTELNNLAYVCGGCNGHKYNKVEEADPLTGQIVQLYNPRQQSWTEHFCWDESHMLIVGMTPIGRATVVALHLNKLTLINLREVLKLADIHPPDYE